MQLFDRIFKKRKHSDYVTMEFCPRCNAILPLQKGFNNSLPYWVCKGCGEMLIGNSIEEDIVWRCDRCEVVLNTQNGFSSDCGEWKCCECGFVNRIDESQVFESVDEYRSQADDPCWGMSDKDVLRLAEYKEVGNVNSRDDIFFVKPPDTDCLFIKKILTTYDKSVYRYLLDNPICHMPQMYGLFEGINKLVVIEEYIEGRSLSDIIDERRLEVNEAADITIQLCKILDALHTLNKPIIHRDIKPSNIIIDNAGEVWLIDINVAKWYRPAELEDTRLLGTPYYAAPEQSGYGKSASSVKSDIYAVGILLNVMITGKLPKEKKAEGEIGKIVDKCISWEPEDRYSARELIEIMQRVLRNDGKYERRIYHA